MPWLILFGLGGYLLWRMKQSPESLQKEYKPIAPPAQDMSTPPQDAPQDGGAPAPSGGASGGGGYADPGPTGPAPAPIPVAPVPSHAPIPPSLGPTSFRTALSSIMPSVIVDRAAMQAAPIPTSVPASSFTTAAASLVPTTTEKTLVVPTRKTAIPGRSVK